jgi:hypothetical protein
MSKVSVSFSVESKLWEDFTSQTSALFLNRGPFLDHMLTRELPYLQEDLKGLKQSQKAKRLVSEAIKQVAPPTPNVNIEVRPETADLLRTVVKEHNLVRDAFFCRLLVLLRGSDKLLDYLEIPRYANDRGLNTLLEEMPMSPIKAMEAIRNDPLFYMRHHVLHIHKCGLYRLPIPNPALHCYIEDEHVEGTAAHKRLSKWLHQL